jgi:hypothetical protein
MKYIITKKGARSCKTLAIATLFAAFGSASASAQTLLLQYGFNETGTTAFNSGTLAGADLTMFNSSGVATDRHTAGGVSGASSDRAFDNTGGGFRAGMSADIAGTDSLQSFTITGWYNTPAHSRDGGPRIVDNHQGGDTGGFYLSRDASG